MGFKIRYCTFPKWLSLPQKSNFLVYGPIWIIIFSLTWKFYGIPNPILHFPQMTLWTTRVQFPCIWTDLNIFFLLWLGNSKSDIVLSPNDCQDHKSPISLFLHRFEYFFSSLTWKFDGDSKSDILNFVFMNVVILVKGRLCWIGFCTSVHLSLFFNIKELSTCVQTWQRLYFLIHKNHFNINYNNNDPDFIII